MINLQETYHFTQLPKNIRIELIDESGKHWDPSEIQDVDYLSRFQNKCVVNKICRDLIGRRKTATVEVYQDKVIVREK